MVDDRMDVKRWNGFPHDLWKYIENLPFKQFFCQQNHSLKEVYFAALFLQGMCGSSEILLQVVWTLSADITLNPTKCVSLKVKQTGNLSSGIMLFDTQFLSVIVGV